MSILEIIKIMVIARQIVNKSIFSKRKRKNGEGSNSLEEGLSRLDQKLNRILKNS